MHSDKKHVSEISDQSEEICQKTLEIQILRRMEENTFIYLLPKQEYNRCR